MDRESDLEMKEIMEELAQDQENGRNRIKDPEASGSFMDVLMQGRNLLLGAGALILVILAFLVIPGGDGDTANQLGLIKTDLARMEERLTALGNTPPGSPPGGVLAKEVREMKQSIARLEQRLNGLADRTARLEKLPASAPETKSPTRTTTAPAQKKPRVYYEIKRGDTLFGIAKDYSTTVEELMRVNRLKKGDNIMPGQRILLP